jgi:TetR/AcrR family transcriptional regulator, fatty acid metabolism regulator protein
MTGTLRVAAFQAEAGDRAVHEGRRQVVGTDAQARGDAGPEPLEDDVCPGAQRACERHVRLQVAGHRLLAGAKCSVPGRRRGAKRIAIRRLDPDDTRAEPDELAAGKGDGEVPGELDDEDPVEWLRVGLHDTYSDRVLSERSIARERPGRDRQAGSEEKRRLILDAAVRVFARDGYHTSRVGDIAEEAGVAHGLLYHYFSSKEEVLATLFRENWGELLSRLARVEQSDEPADEQLRGIAKILLRTWRNDPDLVRVMVREVARSSHLQAQVEEIGVGFATIQRVIERGQAEGVFRADLDPRLASWIFYGGLEEILTGWVLGTLPDGDEEVARAERTIIDVVCGGLAVRDDAGR